jgi:hypothetical protein
MNRFAGIVLAAGICGLLWGEDRALGQPQPGIGMPNQGPAVSPWINLLRNNTGLQGGAAFNAIGYYGLVRPEFNYYNALGGLQQQVTSNQQAIATGLGGAGGVPVTGHPVGFQTQRAYFLTFSGGGLGRGGVGGGTVGQGGGFGGAGGGGAGFGMGNAGMRTGVGGGAVGGAGGGGIPGR